MIIWNLSQHSCISLKLKADFYFSFSHLVHIWCMQALHAAVFSLDDLFWFLFFQFDRITTADQEKKLNISLKSMLTFKIDFCFPIQPAVDDFGMNYTFEKWFCVCLRFFLACKTKPKNDMLFLGQYFRIFFWTFLWNNRRRKALLLKCSILVYSFQSMCVRAARCACQCEMPFSL